MKKLTFDRACVAGVKFKVAGQAMVGFVEVSAVLTPAVATALGARAAIFDDGGRPKAGFVRVDLDAELTECSMHFEVEGAANFVLDLSCPTIDKFVVKRRGNRLLVKFRCGVVGHEQELIEFLKTAGSAEGRLTIDVRAGEQVGLPGIATATAQEEEAEESAQVEETLSTLDLANASVNIDLLLDDGQWYTDTYLTVGRGDQVLRAKLATAVGESSRWAALTEAVDAAAGWARAQVRQSKDVSVQAGAENIVGWCAVVRAEIKAGSDAAQTPATQSTFSERMRAAKTTDEGQGLLHEHEQMIHSLMTHHGLDPLCGPTTCGYKGFSITTSKDRKAAIKDLRLKDTVAGDALHTLIEEGVAMVEPWKVLQLMEMKQGFDEPAAGEDS